MLIHDILKMDHRMVIDIVDAIEMAEVDQRKSMLRLVRTELVMHSKAEEDIFYGPLKERLQKEARSGVWLIDLPPHHGI